MRILVKTRYVFALIALVLSTAGCATQSPEAKASGEIFDPYERTNRSVHSLNLAIDRFAFRPASKGYVAIVPPPMVNSFSYFAENLSMPGQAVNALLQGNPKMAGQALARFAMNTTIGFLGLANPASDFGMPEVDTDFGETLAVWGVGEGAYVELPMYGPSTARDATGILVDFFTNPMGYARNNPADNISIYAEIVRRMGDRGTYSDTVDSILYESADSYAQARLLYLQNRRFQLGETAEISEIDPFELDTEGF
ncbi:MlaA family lipoprotein [Pseudophaeobacter flagellatus]|uniref:MlaA family lipoprotein n=1 Tax=Pseudophaeobacter flagellatus TaxID=2899119 RepID=UPI001E2E99B6|nr:VacJ family lipoprotein [Pseudophaeobacter flagellatus]MCD9148001.1 VacJ family lipoprotein [Pseudophaeobacter flagellatus]